MTIVYTPTRAVMTAEELRAAQFRTHGRDYSQSDDGYEDMALNESRGWKTLSGWGRSGWDLGEWPYVVLSIRPADDGAWHLLSVCEGDHAYYQFATEADLHAAIDYLFLWYAAGKDPARYEHSIGWEQREALDRGEVEVDIRFRGPFSWERCDAEREESQS